MKILISILMLAAFTGCQTVFSENDMITVESDCLLACVKHDVTIRWATVRGKYMCECKRFDERPDFHIDLKTGDVYDPVAPSYATRIVFECDNKKEK